MTGEFVSPDSAPGRTVGVGVVRALVARRGGVPGVEDFVVLGALLVVCWLVG